MPKKPAILVRDVSKTYRMWRSPFARLGVPALFRIASLLTAVAPGLASRVESAASRRVKFHQALSSIDFAVMPGESLGIIGANGSGKSTLLQIIAGVLQPTSGSVILEGRVAALLELGSGFNPELSGRENVRINAAILGFDRMRIESLMPDIESFADIGEYFDEPVKTYSSGMALRLAFAVQVHADPEVLIVDEALAVGDAAFQAKAMDRIERILQKGTTLLFVGHDLNSVKAFCQRAILLEKGAIAMSGSPDDVITEYLYRTHRDSLVRSRAIEPSSVKRIEGGYGLEQAHVAHANLNGGSHAAVQHGETIEIEAEVILHPQIAAPCLIFDIMDSRGLQLSGRRIALEAVHTHTSRRLHIRFPASIQQGIYRVRFRLADSPYPANTTILARQEGILSFEVVNDCRGEFTGLFPLPLDIEVT